ncbi:MAG: hypothetical protein PVS2B1_20760 [Candidatus Dormibacteraceae bacterium]
MILPHLDALVISGRITGYTIEEDTSYLVARVPTLTYRMYADGAESHLNLGAFAAAMAELATVMRLSRVRGTVAEAGMLRRSKQLCLTAEFASERVIGEALDVIYRRFISAPAAAPGSWRYPDVRITGAEPQDAPVVFAHQWKREREDAVVLTLEPEAPGPGARTVRVRVLKSWVSFLGIKGEPLRGTRRSLAFSR